jgi:sec-independent protein translocase protein TatA
MFGIGGGELVFILFIVLMLFGSDKIPEIARTMGKAMAQLKNATNDIKSEIQKGADANGLTDTFKDIHGNFTDVSQNIQAEISKAKDNIANQVTPKIDGVQEEIEDITGPIKRQN